MEGADGTGHGAWASVALLTPLRGFRVERQNTASMASFGSLAGRRWLDLPAASRDLLWVGHHAIEEALDTGRTIRWTGMDERGVKGDMSARLLRTGLVMTTWRPFIEAHPHGSSDLHRIAADLRDLLAELRQPRRSPPSVPSAR